MGHFHKQNRVRSVLLYRYKAGRVPLHLFLGEQLAAELEQQSLRLLDEQITIPTDLIGLFEYGDEPARFARAVAFEQITPHTDRNTGNLSWSAQVPVNGSTKSVSCGDGAFEACRNFAQPDSPSLGHAIEEVWNAVRAAEDQLADVTYPEQLRTKARGRLMPETDTTEPAVRDGLDRTSRMLLCKHAEKIG